MVENYTQIHAKDFSEYLKTGKYTLIDCRTAEEQKIYGVISEDQVFINVNDATAAQQIDKLDKKTPYLIYCWHGNRSAMLRDYMKSEGFDFVCDLEGGIDKWEY